MGWGCGGAALGFLAPAPRRVQRVLRDPAGAAAPLPPAVTSRWVTGPRISGGGPGFCPGQGGCWPSSDSRRMPALRPGSVRPAPRVPASLRAGAPPAASPGADQRAGVLAFCPAPGRIYWGETRGCPRSSPSLSVSPRQLTNIILSYIFKYLAKSKGKIISLSQAREGPGGLCCPLA